MKEKKISDLIQEFSDKVSLSFKDKESQIEELKSKIKDLEVIENRYETTEKRLNKYLKMFKIVPGTLENKEDLLLYFAETLIPIISEKIGSKHSKKIKEYLETILGEKEEEKEIERNYEIVVGTPLEFLSPYLRLGYVEIDTNVLRNYIKNPSSQSFYKWKKRVLEVVIERYGHLVCPIYSCGVTGIHNPISFQVECIIELYNYLREVYGGDIIREAREFMTDVSGSDYLKRKYDIPLNNNDFTMWTYEKLSRAFLIRYLTIKGLLI